jgi:Cu+-exporting ATPase
MEAPSAPEPDRPPREDLQAVQPRPVSPGASLPSSSPHGRGHAGRWLVCGATGAAALVAIHLLVTWGKVDPGQVLALALIVPAVLVGVLNAVLEWRVASLSRALDDVIVVGATLLYALPGLVLVGRGHEEAFTHAALAPVAVLVAVWIVRGVEAIAAGSLQRQADMGALDTPGVVASLFSMPSRFGRSRTVKTARRVALVLSLAALPAGIAAIGVGWMLTGRLLEPETWSLGAAVALSLAPRLVRNVAPPVLAAGLVRGRSAGIVFRDDTEFEKAGRANTLVVRKRGVLVEPGGEVMEFHHLGRLPRETVLALMASCEEIAGESEPASALMRYARREGVAPGDTRLTRWFASRGVQSTSPFGEVYVGNRLFLIENGISVGRGEEAAQAAEKNGHTAIFVSIDREIEAVVVLANRLRDSARPAVERARRAGLASVLVTGDSFRTAESIGRTLGVDQIRPEVAVGSREHEVDRLRDTGHRLAVLGSVVTGPDPGASERDVQVGVGWDGESPLDTRWGVVVTGEDLVRSVQALELCRRCRRLLVANWAVALVAGGLTLGLAASGLVVPVLAAVAVNLASAAMILVRPSTGRT